MGQTLIIVCNRCGGLLLSLGNQKPRTCPYCGKRINVEKAKRVASARNAFEASEILRNMKSNKGFSRK